MGLLNSACGRDVILSDGFDYSDYEVIPLTPNEGQELSTAIDIAAEQYAKIKKQAKESENGEQNEKR